MSPAAPVIFLVQPAIVGMKVIVMQSVAGETTIASVYSQDREWVIYIFALLYLLALCIIGGKQGSKDVPTCLLLFFLRDLCISSACVSWIFTILVSSIYLFSYHTGHYVSDRRTDKRKPVQLHWAPWQVLFLPVSLHGASAKHPAFPATMYLILKR